MLIVNCVVDMGNGNLEMSVDDQKVTFNLFEAIKYPGEDRRCFKVANNRGREQVGRGPQET